MLKTRVLTAVALVIPVFLLIALGPSWLFAGFVLIVIGLGAREWARLARIEVAAVRAGYVAMLVGVAAVLLLIWDAQGWTAVHRGILWLAMLWWAGVLLGLTVYQPGIGRRPWGAWLLRFAGFPTLIPAALALVWLHDSQPMLVVYLLVLVAAADTGAYFVGRRFGRTQLAPEISPGKTREGLVGALAAVFPVAVLGAWLLGQEPLDALTFVLLSIVVALVSVAGDLHESVLKREAGAKDSGSLLPGHGGVLDRVDSLTAAAPAFAVGLLWTGLFASGVL